MIEQIHEVKVIIRTFRKFPADPGLIEALVSERIRSAVGQQMSVPKIEATEVYRQAREEGDEK
jgi:hypothetical protein